MPSTPLFVSITLLAAAISTPLLAGDHDQRSDRQQVSDKRAAGGFDYRMQVVGHDAAPDTPGHGWRYFSDPAGRRAVVISPQGDYYYSRGKGLHWVAAEQV